MGRAAAGMLLYFLYTTIDNVSLDRIKASDEYNLVSLYESYDDTDDTTDNDSPFQYETICVLIMNLNNFTRKPVK